MSELGNQKLRDEKCLVLEQLHKRPVLSYHVTSVGESVRRVERF